LPEVGLIDGRRRPALLFREVAEAMIVDRGGKDLLTGSEQQLIRRAAGLTVLADQIEEKLVRGGAIVVSTYANFIGRKCRVLLALGLDRRARLLDVAIL
jgi:hypothetical protein